MTTFQAMPGVCPMPRACNRLLLAAQLLADEASDLATVRPPLGFAHHEADQWPNGLHIPVAHLLRRVRLGLKRPVDDLLELARVLHLPEPLALDDLRWVSPLGDQRR